MKELIRSSMFILISIILVSLTLFQCSNSRPDLIIGDVHILKNNYLASNSYSITIKNIGDKSISLDKRGKIQAYGIEVLVLLSQGANCPEINSLNEWALLNITLDLGRLDPGISITDTIIIEKPKLLDKGAYACFIVDPDNNVEEINEENNIVHAMKLFEKEELEVMKKRQAIPLAEYLGYFKHNFPAKGESWIKYVYEEYDFPFRYILIQLENGSILGPVLGTPYSYKIVNSDITWITSVHHGEYGGETSSLLYVLNTKNSTFSDAYLMSHTFAEDGWYDHQNGDFINDSTFEFKHYWNDESFKDDSAFGTFVIRNH